MSKLTKEMCIPRSAKNLSGDGWWYVSPKHIEIMATSKTGLTAVTLTRKQLERALEIMDNYSKDVKL